MTEREGGREGERQERRKKGSAAVFHAVLQITRERKALRKVVHVSGAALPIEVDTKTDIKVDTTISLQADL